MTIEYIIQTLKYQSLRHDRIATVTAGYAKNDHLELAECFMEAALMIERIEKERGDE